MNYVKFGELDNHPSERTERLRRAFARADVRSKFRPIYTGPYGRNFSLSRHLAASGP